MLCLLWFTILLGLIIGAIICLIVTQDIMVTLFSAFIGIGMACTYALMFPLTFKFGPENSNVIMLTTAVVAVALFLSMWFFAVMPILIKAGSISKIASNPLVLVATGSYALLGVIIFVISYFSSLSIFKKQELYHQRVFIEEHTFALFYIWIHID
ncbi:ABC-2 transporter permease [Mycobacteroides chelonae]|nr:ABC-2 transporter permease [Mycobacteroides chelonae]